MHHPSNTSGGPPQSLKVVKNTTRITKLGSAMFFRGKEGEKPTQNHEMEGISDFFYPILLLVRRFAHSLPQGCCSEPECNKKTTKVYGFGLAVFLWVKSRTAPLYPSNVKPLSYVLPHHPPGGAHHHAITLGAPLRASKQPDIPL